MSRTARLAIDWTEQGLLPDRVVRAGIRRLLKQRLAEIDPGDAEATAEHIERFVAEMDRAPLALVPDLANEQHYEVPAAFYALALGRHRKYSACYWPVRASSLDDAEAAALAATAERAGIEDGMDVLELGCGWGSLTLYCAERYPRSRITAVSNSHSQRAYILAEAARRGLGNLEVLTEDMNRFDTPWRFDRVVSVEMFEHMRNWRALFARVHDWLKPGGRFFLHVFTHRSTPYAFEIRDDSDWMSRHFFSGGMMPSDELATRFQDRLHLVRRWRWDGTHYERTANAWLANLDARREEALTVLAGVHGTAAAPQWLQRWRVFFMACAELFGYERGQQWWVSHYLFERPERPDA
ncbi:MAG TPA: cyclopropane-fatty-acyl-phospholipid synthase family protein [Steroidobacteraceae bacterium]|nr:cyclopropane-fatty-acyl-phospholipid synthase family protein [Steroidobacteraceae bacterium]